MHCSSTFSYLLVLLWLHFLLCLIRSVHSHKYCTSHNIHFIAFSKNHLCVWHQFEKIYSDHMKIIFIYHSYHIYHLYFDGFKNIDTTEQAVLSTNLLFIQIYCKERHSMALIAIFQIWRLLWWWNTNLRSCNINSNHFQIYISSKNDFKLISFECFVVDTYEQLGNSQLS